jgi:hypothetical protein
VARRTDFTCAFRNLMLSGGTCSVDSLSPRAGVPATFTSRGGRGGERVGVRGANITVCPGRRAAAHRFAPPRAQIIEPLVYALALRRIRDTGAYVNAHEGRSEGQNLSSTRPLVARMSLFVTSGEWCPGSRKRNPAAILPRQ